TDPAAAPAPDPLAGEVPSRPAAARAAAAVTGPAPIAATPAPSATVISPVSLRRTPRVASIATRLASAATASALTAGRMSCTLTARTVSGSGDGACTITRAASCRVARSTAPAPAAPLISTAARSRPARPSRLVLRPAIAFPPSSSRHLPPAGLLHASSYRHDLWVTAEATCHGSLRPSTAGTRLVLWPTIEQ